MKTVAFFNNKGGVGKTSLVYHLAWMFAGRGHVVLAVDLDPQANLTSMFMDEERLDDLWNRSTQSTIYGALTPLIKRTGDIEAPHLEKPANGLHLIPGNLALSNFEDLLSENWPKCLDGQASAFRVLSAFHRVILLAAKECHAELILIDVGPNLGAINRSAIITAKQVVVPLAPDLFSLQGLKNLGPALRMWREGWEKRKRELPKEDAAIDLPSGDMTPAGYVVMQHSIRGTRPVKAYQRWMDRIPTVYREHILNETATENTPPAELDPYRLALLKHYRSLMPMAMDARKPMFSLKPADGAIGAHVDAVTRCYDDFLKLASRIAEKAGMALK